MKVEIETLILVAIWETPFIFQGCFNLTDKKEKRQRLLGFRCECEPDKQSTQFDHDFHQYHYCFTHLYGKRQDSTDVTERVQFPEDSYYILRYALCATLEKMKTSPMQNMRYVDEEAMQAFTNKIKPIVIQGQWHLADEDIGFAVSIPFEPKEERGQKAILALLGEK